MEKNILANIDESLCLTEEIKSLALKTKLFDETDTSYWFQVSGDIYGVDRESVDLIMYEDGTTPSDEFLAENWELFEVLKAAALSIKK